MGKHIIEEDLIIKESIIDPASEDGQRIHAFLLSRAKKLAGDKIDFNKTPVTFVLSDKKEPNAFFAPIYKRKKDDDDGYYSSGDIRVIKNPLDTSIICVSKGLIDMVDNLDQLDFVLGHENTHLLMRGFGIGGNSKGEETISDLHSVDLVYDSGGDAKESLKLCDKIQTYAEKIKKEHEESHYRHERPVEGLDWSEILDVHLTHKNRISGVKAALTRLSHLIDDRQPTPLDKSIFDVSYTDPLDDFLRENNFENQKPFGQLRLLIAAIDQISEPIPAEDYYQNILDSLPPADENSWDTRRERIQEIIDEGYPDYYSGKVLDLKYMQKIAWLAEDVKHKIDSKETRSFKEREARDAAMREFNTYVHNTAYQKILEHGYPKYGDQNYDQAAALLYTYFHVLTHVSRHSRDDDAKTAFRSNNALHLRNVFKTTLDLIYKANTLDDLKSAIDHFETLKAIDINIRLQSKTENHNTNKFEAFSFMYARDGQSSGSYNIYKTPQENVQPDWQNLFDIAQSDEAAKDYIVEFLLDQGIKDYRLTHSLPYIKKGGKHYKLNEDGIVLQEIKAYEISYILNKSAVDSVYDYISKYFNDEPELFEQARASLLNIEESDYSRYDNLSEKFNRSLPAGKKLDRFINTYNSLPEITRNQSEARYHNTSATSLLIPGTTDKEDFPGKGEDGNYLFDTDLLKFENPIFQKRFGKSFKQKWTKQKTNEQQKMFDATLSAIDMLSKQWLEVTPEVRRLKKQQEELIESYNQSESPESKERIDAQLKDLSREIDPLENRQSMAKGFIEIALFSVFHDNSGHQLHRLTENQKHQLINLVVNDKQGAFIRMFGEYKYASFCNLLAPLSPQIDRLISGDYSLTETMQNIIRNISNNVDQDGEESKRSNGSIYTRYMAVFNMMQTLETNPKIEIKTLYTTIDGISTSKPSSFSGGSETEYENYKKIVTQSNLTNLITQVINSPENYPEKDSVALLHIAENICKLRSLMHDILGEDEEYTYEHEYGYTETATRTVFKPEHQKLLDLLDQKATDIVDKRYNEIMNLDDRFERIKELYNFYNPKHKRRDKSALSNATEHFHKHSRNKDLKGHILKLSTQKDFWPEDPLEHVKSYVLSKNLFLDDVEFENQLVNDICDKLDAMPSSDDKRKCVLTLMDKSLRSPYPDTRERLFDLYANDMVEQIGPDDCSESYYKTLEENIQALDKPRQLDIRTGLLSNNLALADKQSLLRKVSDAVMSQEETSKLLKDASEFKANAKDLMYSYLEGIGLDTLTSTMDDDPKTAKAFVTFFNSKGEKSDCEKICNVIRNSDRARNYFSEHDLEKKITPENCNLLYQNFWSAPLEARAVITARTLESAVNSDTANENKESWENVFDLVMDTVIPKNDTSIEARYARDIIHSYIGARGDYERELILSAMMVTNRNLGGEKGNVAKALRLFLENMGPAEVKLGQAIASHPTTPKDIKTELQKLKNQANIPARWTIFDWMKDEKIPEELWKGLYLGKIRAGSYYATVELGDDKIMRILKPEAREKAQKGFRVIRDTIENLKEKDTHSDLAYGELTASVSEMVIQAARMSHIETDQDIGQTQYETAKAIYDGVKMSVDGFSFTLKTMDWDAKGENWVRMDRAQGEIFNELPEETAEQITYKKAFAKLYIIFELRQMISGKKFDHDKHGAQLCIDPKTNVVGIFDTGAMALCDPSLEDKKLLGHILHEMAYKMKQGNASFLDISETLNDTIECQHALGQDTQYLTEVKKGILALGDFMSVLDPEEIEELVTHIDIASHISDDTKQVVMSKMSLVEKAEFAANSFKKAVNDNNAPIIMQQKSNENIKTNVLSFSTHIDKAKKSRWFDDLFCDEKQDSKIQAENLKSNFSHPFQLTA